MYVNVTAGNVHCTGVIHILKHIEAQCSKFNCAYYFMLNIWDCRPLEVMEEVVQVEEQEVELLCTGHTSTGGLVRCQLMVVQDH